MIDPSGAGDHPTTTLRNIRQRRRGGAEIFHHPAAQPRSVRKAADDQVARYVELGQRAGTGTAMGDQRSRPAQSGWTIFGRRRHRQKHHRVDEERRPRHRQGLAWLNAGTGPAIYIGAEDDENEIHIRLAAIAKHYDATFKELIDGELHVLCLLGDDATLCAASDKSGKVEVTSLYRQLYEAAGDIKPKNISIDTLSRAFAGNEIDRVQVYAFAMHMQALAMVAGGSVTVLSHPSLAGIASGSGISGSTAWHGAFRFRQYLKGIKPTMASSPTTIFASWNSRRTNTGRPAKASCCAISAACSCRKAEFPASTSWRGSKRQKKYSWPCLPAMTAKAGTSAKSPPPTIMHQRLSAKRARPRVCAKSTSKRPCGAYSSPARYGSKTTEGHRVRPRVLVWFKKSTGSDRVTPNAQACRRTTVSPCRGYKGVGNHGATRMLYGGNTHAARMLHACNSERLLLNWGVEVKCLNALGAGHAVLAHGTGEFRTAGSCPVSQGVFKKPIGSTHTRTARTARTARNGGDDWA